MRAGSKAHATGRVSEYPSPLLRHSCGSLPVVGEREKGFGSGAETVVVASTDNAHHEDFFFVSAFSFELYSMVPS